MKQEISDRLKIIESKKGNFTSSLYQDVQTGLFSEKKYLDFKYFYDSKGSELFEKIMGLKEYYPTNCEREILEKYADEIVKGTPQHSALIELGSGNSKKTGLLIDALIRKQNTLTYAPIEISKEILEISSEKLLKEYQNLTVLGFAYDYNHVFERINEIITEPKIIIFLGSSIGNYSSNNASNLLSKLSSNMNENDCILLGADLIKEIKVLENAYNDSEGITAQFNLNVLNMINRELDADFIIDNFEHKAFYNESENRIEMHIFSKINQSVRINAMQATVFFRRGETIHTENSYKYSKDSLSEICSKADLTITKQWFDSKEYFSLNKLEKIIKN